MLHEVEDADAGLNTVEIDDDLLGRLPSHPESLAVTEYNSVGLEVLLLGQIKVVGLGVGIHILFLGEVGDGELITETAE